MLGKRKINFLLMLLALILPNLLFGASIDTSNTIDVLTGVKIAFVALCGITTTILVIYTGFKLYNGQTLAELSKLLWVIAAFGTATALGAFVDDFMK